MSFFDKLKDAIAQTQKEVAKEATKRAAKGAFSKMGDAFNKAADGVLSDAEANLERKQAAAEGRPGVLPDSSHADDSEKHVQDAASRAQALRKEREDRERSAHEELARLKAARDAAKESE